MAWKQLPRSFGTLQRTLCEPKRRPQRLVWPPISFQSLSPVKHYNRAHLAIPTSGDATARQTRQASTTVGSQLRKTPLFDFHITNGAKMVPFGGFSMPVTYDDLGIKESHLWTREKASLFDVSHMVQHNLKGPGAEGLLSRLTPAGLQALPVHQSTLSCFLHPSTGGIVDDSIITRIGPEAFYFVTNAACREKDCSYLAQSIEQWTKDGGKDVQWNVLESQGLVALQGPLAAQILKRALVDPTEVDLDRLYFGQSKLVKLLLQSGQPSSNVLVSRGGYTGEDGFEISIPSSETVEVVDALIKTSGPEQMRLAGLGARDSLRLEAGMCLYGHDLDDSTTPVEGGLSWVVSKDRRARGDFNGADVILAQLKPVKDGGSGVKRRRIGLIVEGPPARQGAEITSADGEPLGIITSGCPSPSLEKNIAMGYVKSGFHKSGTEVVAVVRGKKHRAMITKMPFVPSKYWKGGASPG